MPASDQGVNLDRYMLVPRTLIFLTQGDKVLLLKGAADKHLWAGIYNGVGGHIEQGEDVLSAARRELWEETGISATNLWLCGIITVDTQTNPGVGVFIFKGEADSTVLKFSKEGTLEWVESSKVNQLPLVADLTIILSKILQMKPGDAPLAAHSFYNSAGEMVVTLA